MKLAHFDIETTALRTRTWGIWEQNAIKVDEDWKLLCFSYKEPGKKTVFHRKHGKNEKALVKKLWHFLDEYDVIVAHNGKKFDIKKSNAKFLEYGMKPPSPYMVIDTLTEAKKYFALTSNKLDAIARLLDLKPKENHDGFATWEGCERGDPKAWKVMEKYNRYDVELLEQVYDRLLPWITQAKATWNTKLNCPHCGSPETQSRGKSTTEGGKQRKRHQCTDCGKWFLGNYIIKKV